MDLDVDQQIARTRAARKRRDRLWSSADAALLIAYLITLGASFRSDNPLLALVTLGYAIFTALRPLMVDGRDAWQLRRAMQSFSIAGAAVLVYLVVDVILLSARDGYETQPGGALSLFALVWLIANLVVQYGAMWRRIIGRQPNEEQ